MREILFRGKRIGNEEWVEGGYKCEKVGVYFTAVFIVEHLTNGVWENHRVSLETVGQFTGLYDKNGTKIFEGDVVRFEQFSYKYNGKIVFNKKTCAFEVWFTTAVGGYGAKARHSVLLCHVDAIEVIGNIHDNPELLK